jgi:flagellar L-ring protein precursor FlgH
MKRTVLTLALLLPLSASAADLYPGDNWSALASDRVAHRVGDSLTVLIYESASAVNSANTGSTRRNTFNGNGSAGLSTQYQAGASLGLDASSSNEGTTERSGGMVAQLSVIVDAILPNGDLHVSGGEILVLNGDETNIRVRGRVRLADISGNNTVLSSRLAGAEIDYNGYGFVARSSAPGVITRVFNWLGLP